MLVMEKQKWLFVQLLKRLWMESKLLFLVPTTILAQQHYETITRAISGLSDQYWLLSRFRSKKQQTETIKGLKNGTVDIVIGTHRLLSKDVDLS